MGKPFKQTVIGKALFGNDYPVVVFLRRMFEAGLLAKIGAVLGAVAGASLGLHVGMVAAGGALLFGGAALARALISPKTVQDKTTPREKLKARFNRCLPLALSTVWVMGTSMLFLPGKKKEFNENATPDKGKTEVSAPKPQRLLPSTYVLKSARV